MMLKTEFACFPRFNFALQQSGVQLIQNLSITNETDAALTDLVITLKSEPQFFETKQIRIAEIPAGRTLKVKDCDITTDAKFLRELTESINGEITIDINQDETQLFSDKYHINILPFDYWPGINVLPGLLASYVIPNYPAISQILFSAAQILKEWTGNSALDEYQSRNPDRVQKQMAAIYEAICRLNIIYCTPPPSYEEAGQRIRLCDTLLSDRLGTCLVMSLLYSACCVAAGFHPLTVLIQGPALACGWRIDVTFPDSFNDDVSLLLNKKADGINDIAFIETTCMNEGKNSGFDKAQKIAVDHLLKTDKFIFSIDVKRSRLARILPRT